MLIITKKGNPENVGKLFLIKDKGKQGEKPLGRMTQDTQQQKCERNLRSRRMDDGLTTDATRLITSA